MLTDAGFCHPVHDFVSRRIADKRNIFDKISTFQYRYTHQGQLSLSMILGQGGPYGVNHADELFLMFSPIGGQKIILNDEDQQMSDILLALWKSFVKTGNPSTNSITWDPIKSALSRKYLNLNLTPLMEYPNETRANMEFWDNLIPDLEQIRETTSNCG